MHGANWGGGGQRLQIFNWMGVKFNEYFFELGGLKNYSYLDMTLPLDFFETVNIFTIRLFLFYFENSRIISPKKLK